jgi:glycosyltransferase involved in cell wall biosynthesis
MTLEISGSTSVAVSIIIPARNEEGRLRACLESLIPQAGVKFEILVVDDGSTDRTKEIARSFSGVTVVDAGPLPDGWTGKTHAMAVGAEHAQGQWLLFTDADTVHFPHSLQRAMSEADRNGAGMLSYSPKQQVRGLLQKAVMAVVFAELASAYPPHAVSDPASEVAAANGQYLLISREAYDATGGYAAIASSLLEDVAMAKAVKRSGRKMVFRYGGDAVSTYMYRNFSELREGWTKNLALLFPHAIAISVLRAGEFLLIAGGAVTTVITAMNGQTRLAIAAVAVTATSLALSIGRMRKSHFQWDTVIVSFIGLPIFSYLLLRSYIFHRRGKVSWKGRTYATRSSTIARLEPSLLTPRSG